MKIYLQQQESRRCCWLKGNRQAHPGGSISLKALGWRQTDGASGWSIMVELQGGAPRWSSGVAIAALLNQLPRITVLTVVENIS